MEMFYWNILKQAKRKFDNALWQIISLVLLSIIMVVLWKLFQSLKYFSLIFSIERYLTKLTFGFWIFLQSKICFQEYGFNSIVSKKRYGFYCVRIIAVR